MDAVGAVTARSRGAFFWLPASLLRTSGVGTLAGLLAGFVAGGIGSRLAMKTVAIVAGPEARGRITENGNAIGAFTGETIFLLVAGAFLGILGGVIYMALRPWLPRSGRWRGLAFGGVLLATFGTSTIEGNNFDFTHFGIPVLNIALFAALFFLFGLLVAWLADRFDRVFPAIPPRRAIGPGTFVAYALLAGSGLLGFALPILAGIAFASGDGAGRHLTFLILALLAIALVARIPLALGGPTDAVPAPDGRAGRVGSPIAFALILPVLIGLAYTVRAIATILGG